MKLVINPRGVDLGKTEKTPLEDASRPNQILPVTKVLGSLWDPIGYRVSLTTSQDLKLNY